MIKAVLFDLDGTLIDTNKLVIESFKHTLRKHKNICPPDCEITKYFGEPLLTTLARYDEKNVDELRKTYHEFNEAVHDEMAKEIEGAKEVLEELRNLNIKTGVVTSKRRVMAERGLKLFKLFNLLDVLITPEDTEKHKPDPEPVLKACEILGVKPEEALMVGDSHYDILCGKNAGTQTCLVKYTVLPIENIIIHNPDHTVDRIIDILDIVK
jgi:pyrophosphatase PpaX